MSFILSGLVYSANRNAKFQSSSSSSDVRKVFIAGLLPDPEVGTFEAILRTQKNTDSNKPYFDPLVNIALEDSITLEVTI